jgi:hypothetical protein
MRQSDRQYRQSIANLNASHKARQVRFVYELLDETVICIPTTRAFSMQIILHRHCDEKADYAIFHCFFFIDGQHNSIFYLSVIKFYIILIITAELAGLINLIYLRKYLIVFTY